MPDELWTEVCDVVKETGSKIIPKKKKIKKAKWWSEEALQTAVKRREAQSKGGKERYSHLNAEFQRIARRDNKAFLSDHSKRQGIPEKNIYICFTDYVKAFDSVDHNKLWKVLKEMGIPAHLT